MYNKKTWKIKTLKWWVWLDYSLCSPYGLSFGHYVVLFSTSVRTRLVLRPITYHKKTALTDGLKWWVWLDSKQRPFWGLRIGLSIWPIRPTFRCIPFYTIFIQNARTFFIFFIIFAFFRFLRPATLLVKALDLSYFACFLVVVYKP